MILRVWDNDRREIKLDQAEFITMDSLSKNSAFNVVGNSDIGKASNSLFDWLAKTQIKK